jgi:hypothetical protein
MGENRDGRVGLDKRLAKLRAEHSEAVRRQKDEQNSAAECDQKISSLALPASRGDKGALDSQLTLREKLKSHIQQAENFASSASTLQDEIDLAEAELEKAKSYERVELITGKMALLPAQSAEIDRLSVLLAEAVGGYQQSLDQPLAEILSSIGGDQSRTERLRDRSRSAVGRAVRAALAAAFVSQGMQIIDVRDLTVGLKPAERPTSFAQIMTPFLQSLRTALEANLPPGQGTACFIATTNINGLFNLNVKAGERLSLPVADKKVQELVANGALEKISDASAAAGAAA